MEQEKDNREYPETRHRGTNQGSMRAHNERLILTLLRTEGALPKVEIAHLTGLSAQTVSVITRALEADGLLKRGTPRRGGRGQPSVPISLDGQGATLLGLHIGRRQISLVQLDFCGSIENQWREVYPWPTPDAVIAFVQSHVRVLEAELSQKQFDRIAGLGIAMPGRLWQWADLAGAPQDVLDDWQRRDVCAELDTLLRWPVFSENDATAACNAELVFGQVGRTSSDFVYVYVDTFIGGGLSLNRSVVPGAHGNTASLGSMLISDLAGRSRQLLEVASLTGLEALIRKSGLDSRQIHENPNDWSGLEDLIDLWLPEAINGIAHAIVNASALLEFDGVIVDGALPLSIRSMLVSGINDRLQRLLSEGLDLPPVTQGSLGANAVVLGGASLPLSERFLVDFGALMVQA